MQESLVEFFSTYKQAVLTAHVLGVIVGMGGATITDILFFNFLRDFTISKKESDVMRLLSNLIMVALSILYISGTGLFLSDIVRYSNSPAFLAKALIVVVITVNGILMHKFIAPHMVRLSFQRHPMKRKKYVHVLRRISFGMGAVSFTSWYSAFFIAMLKSYLPPAATLAHILSVYGVILICAVCVSQCMHYFLLKKSTV